MSIIENNSVVTMDFQLFAADGRLVDNRLNYEFIQGIDDVLVGMRSYLEGAKVGSCIQGKVSAKEAFGEVVDFEPLTYPKEAIGPGFHKLYIGFDMPFETADGGRVSLFVKDLTSTAVTFTINHPLAGQDIKFIATVNAIRQATEEELEQGYPTVHGSSCACC